jgi:hypothetical protein
MSTRTTQNAVMNAACRELLNERLGIALGQSVHLGEIRASLDSGRVGLSGLRSLVRSPELSGVLGKLAPASFARAQASLGNPANTLNLSAATLSARAALADAVGTAAAVIDGATRDLTAEAITGAAAELGYTCSYHRGGTATGVELWRGDELLLLRIHDGGVVESDHLGLADASCGDRQRELEAAVGRRGVTFTGRKRYNHGSRSGGDLIMAAAARKDPSLARATVADAERQRAAGPRASQMFRSGQNEPSHLARERRRGGAA